MYDHNAPTEWSYIVALPWNWSCLAFPNTNTNSLLYLIGQCNTVVISKQMRRPWSCFLISFLWTFSQVTPPSSCDEMNHDTGLPTGREGLKLFCDYNQALMSLTLSTAIKILTTEVIKTFHALFVNASHPKGYMSCTPRGGCSNKDMCSAWCSDSGW